MADLNLKPNTRYEILTPSGFKLFRGIVTQKKEAIKFNTNQGSITVSKDHAFIINENVVPSTGVKVGDYFSKVQYVTGIEFLDSQDLYDPIDVGDDHFYFGNDIVHHNCTFLGSSHTLIAADTIAKMSPIPPIFSNNEGLDYLEQPVKGHRYFTVVDTSRGVGGDYSALTVIDITQFPYKLVAKYRNNKISPLLYPSVIYRVCKDFNDAWLLVETNDIGQQVADILYQDMEYDQIIMVGSDSKTGQYLSSGFRTGSALGVKTSKAVKRIGCSTLKTLVENQKLLVHDADVIAEFSTFVEVRESHKADEGYHDDLIMTLVLFAWAFHDPYFATITDISQRHSIFEDQIKQIEEELTPFGFHNTGQDEEVVMEVESGDLWFTGNPATELEKLTKKWTSNI